MKIFDNEIYIIYDLYSIVSNKRLNYEFIRLINSVMNIEIGYKSSTNGHKYEMYCDGLKIAECTIEMNIKKYKKNDMDNFCIAVESSGVKTTCEYEDNKSKYTIFSDYSYKDLYRYKKEVDNIFK